MIDPKRTPRGPEPSRRDALAAGVTTVGGLLAAGSTTAQEEPKVNAPDRKYDVVVIGGGPAGLSAALVLGRACRKVLVVDSGTGRNAPARAVHGFFTRDGDAPTDLRTIGREQLKPYAVTTHDGTATAAEPTKGGFEVTLNGKAVVACRKLILATGMTDTLPDLPGIRDWWGSGVLHCPYCHGWEVRDRPWAFIAPPEYVVERATLFLGWTKNLTYLTNGAPRPAPEQTKWLAAHKVGVREERITELEGKDRKLTAIAFEGGPRLETAAVFAFTKLAQRSDLPKRLGCKLVTGGPLAGMVETTPLGVTSVPGVYAVGDASSTGIPSVAGAVADGAAAAGAANHALLTEDAG